MIPTFIGLFIILAGAVLLFVGSVPAMFSMVMLCSLMGGSAALLLPALGGSSIPPTQFALVFMFARLLLPGSGQGAIVLDALRRNVLLMGFVLWGVAIAMLGPRIFAGAMQVVPLRMTSARGSAETIALGFSAQNITSAVYLIGTFLIAVAATAACMNHDGVRRFVRMGLVIAWMHIVLGVLGLALSGTIFEDVLALFRNGNYAQTEQVLENFSRIQGIAPEPSVYASFGFAWFVFLFECWLREIHPRRTGTAAAAMAAVLLFSTSSTAYLGLGAYGALLLIRSLLIPQPMAFRKVLVLGMAGIGVAVVVTAILLLRPGLVAAFTDMIQMMTVGKTGSDSAVERALWARQGLDAFRVSFGLGVGPGSFRSSSFLTAMLGSTGVLGAALFAAYLAHMFKPLRASTYARSADVANDIGAAASWTALAVLIPASVISPSTDPGSEFAIFAGVALALRWSKARASMSPSAPARRLPLQEELSHAR
ncbi:MAG: hypothetical protein ABW128_04760 [Rhizorhabdus sp.]